MMMCTKDVGWLFLIRSFLGAANFIEHNVFTLIYTQTYDVIYTDFVHKCMIN